MSRFQSTLPAREATLPVKLFPAGQKISIHASREGSDKVAVAIIRKLNPISIHASREGSDPAFARLFQLPPHFNPRFPRGKRRVTWFDFPFAILISIHASREGSDSAVRLYA